MLPTEKASNIAICHNDYLQHDINNFKHYVQSCINKQHLYIISNDKPQENDWVYEPTVEGKICRYMKLPKHYYDGAKKIIATTDTSLKIYEEQIGKNGLSRLKEITLPQISEDFIQHYIIKYNNGNIITEAYAKYSYTIDKSLGHFHQIRNYNVFLNNNKVVLSLTKKDMVVDKILVFCGNQPCLNISGDFGLNRDRDPDNGWGQLRNTIITSAKEVKLTPELKKIVLADLAYAYGSNSKVFIEKLTEFNII